MLISKFYNLRTEGYFKDIFIDDETKEKLVGYFPEVDWVICGIRTEETIDKLMKNRKFNVAKKLFAKTKEDEELFDKWVKNKEEKEF